MLACWGGGVVVQHVDTLQLLALKRPPTARAREGAQTLAPRMALGLVVLEAWRRGG